MRAWLSLIVLAQTLAVGAPYAESVAVPGPGDAPVLSTSPDPTLGPWAVDENGNVGRIHTVITGDTLWDISSTYLGTAWVWPAVWRDNDDIENPHLIVPEDRIWITAGEMRKITRERANAMIAARDQQSDAVSEEVVEAVEEVIAEPLPSSRSIRVAERGAMGFVSRSAVEAATSIVGSPSAREWLAGGDIVYIGQGMGEVAVGDELTLFRDAEPVYDIRRGRQLGYHVDILGWLVVREVKGDSATAEIRMSRSEIARGDRLIPRISPRLEVEVKSTPGAAEGNIVFIPEGRSQVADGDYVYLNRGTSDGLDLGSEMEVFSPGSIREERVRSKKVMTPDRTDASLVVVEVSPNTAVGYVVGSKRALEVGDQVRPVAPRVARR
ncbi:MAG TPA: LysM domain-containing protein [Myxococcales bacterium]|nr:LysM domain-containing protein [Myxococcales bacterium]HIL80938.1 LysM domain-containing protein [Myxococcales bacterium]